MGKRILFIRTFKFLAAGGSVPPLGLLYIASVIRRTFSDKYQLKPKLKVIFRNVNVSTNLRGIIL